MSQNAHTPTVSEKKFFPSAFDEDEGIMQKKTFDNYDSPEYARIGAILKREEFRKVKSYSNTPKAHSIASNEDSFDRL